MNDLYKAKAPVRSGALHRCIFYKPNHDYRGYVQFTKLTMSNLKHNQVLPKNAEVVTMNDMSKSLLKMLDFLDSSVNSAYHLEY